MLPMVKQMKAGAEKLRLSGLQVRTLVLSVVPVVEVVVVEVVENVVVEVEEEVEGVGLGEVLVTKGLWVGLALWFVH